MQRNLLHTKHCPRPGSRKLKSYKLRKLVSHLIFNAWPVLRVGRQACGTKAIYQDLLRDCSGKRKQPLTPGSLSVWLFCDVQNSRELREQIVEGALEPEAAFIKASMVPDLFIIRLAAYQALLAHHNGSLTTRSLHSELLFNLSGSKHIAESLKKFGVSEGCSSLLVARFDAASNDGDQIATYVQGNLTPISGLSSCADPQAIKEAYKILPLELELGSLADAVCGRMSTRSC
ncbi:hypothetical protein WJX84_001340 [Apatococcus fuscideae]|uniref:EKC/KEOPS complex subunit CGI121 n=1 Tax=Apatococcus fuscideae TaxID=2026836 RepID=A0AAW1T3G7_9CHLO